MKRFYLSTHGWGDLCPILMKERVTMQITKIFLLLTVIIMLSGCATWRDREGNKVPESIKAACDYKCSYYKNNQAAYTYEVCFKECMDSKGYSKY